MSQDVTGQRPPTFDKGIQRLGERRFKSQKMKERWLSRWFQSYLHTLRVLRNESVHSQTVEEGQFPVQMEPGDLVVLTAALSRVLELQLKWMSRPPTGDKD